MKCNMLNYTSNFFAMFANTTHNTLILLITPLQCKLSWAIQHSTVICIITLLYIYLIWVFLLLIPSTFVVFPLHIFIITLSLETKLSLPVYPIKASSLFLSPSVVVSYHCCKKFQSIANTAANVLHQWMQVQCGLQLLNLQKQRTYTN